MSPNKKQIGLTKERISAIGLGTWNIRDYRTAFDTFVYALNRGIDNIDTAEMYDSGRAEIFVGDIIKEVGRESVFVTTKMLPSNLVSTESVIKAARLSLKRLNINYVDLFLIHWPNRTIPIEVQIKNFEVVYLRGYARYIGVSNFSRKELEIALNSTKKAEIVVNQVHYSVLNKQVESNLLPFCVERGITIQAYSPIERGYVKNIPLLKDIALKYHKTPIQVALNYLIIHPRVVAIVKTERRDHLDEILGSLDWKLKPGDINLIKNKL